MSQFGRKQNRAQYIDLIQNSPNQKKIFDSEIFKKFVLEFVPDTSIEDGMTRYEIPESVVNSLKQMRIEPENQLNYLSIYFLKVYRGHITCCHQGFELRNYFDVKSVPIDSLKDPFLFEFNSLTNVFPRFQTTEFINSSLVYDYISKHRNLLKNNEIKREYELVTRKIDEIR
jgi:hypothetical protein